MKKTYSKPEALEVVFETQGVIATSIQMYDNVTVDTSNGEQLTNKGGWNSSNWE